LLISKGNLTQNSLKGEVAIVTGAGRGIGFEAARALVWLGANVVIAENDEKNGKNAEENLKVIDGWVNDATALVKILNC
jgi:NAD(P)-dependent dehydrogenase (short-subunit alcohol dehydrogenase family)